MKEIANALNQMKEIANALKQTLVSPNVRDSNGESANIVDAIDKLAEYVGGGLRALGNADAATPMGALENHAKCMLEASENIAGAIRELADAVRESGGSKGA